MSLITITKDTKIPESKSILVRSDAKNALLTRTLKESWTEMSGLSWIFVDDDNNNSMDFYRITN